MGNLIDYLAWRGDLPFSKDPFNSIDACLLSALSYIDFTDIVPSKGMGKVTMREASRLFFKYHTEEELSKVIHKFLPFHLKSPCEQQQVQGRDALELRRRYGHRKRDPVRSA